MRISKDTIMLLFRFRNYKSNPFIEKHLSEIRKFGYVWMLKIGKRTSISNLEAIKQAGGWMILRAPKSEQGKSYLTHFVDYSEELPSDGIYPKYYNDILDENSEDFLDIQQTYQWFKIDSIEELPDKEAEKLILSKTGKTVDEVIGTTRTAVMYVKNAEDICM